MGFLNPKAFLGLIIFLCLLVTFLLPVFFFVTHIDHECTGDDCPVCAQIHNSSEILRRLFGGLSNVLPADFVCMAVTFLFCLSQKFLSIEQLSPVSLKIRLND
jgi:hypothetical protein